MSAQLHPVEYVQCPHCTYWHHPDRAHEIADCASNWRAVNQQIARERAEWRGRAEVAEEELAELKTNIRRLVVDG